MDERITMESEAVGVLQGNSGASPEGAVQTPVFTDTPESPTNSEPPRAGLSKEEIEKLPSELRPLPDGTYPAITPKLLKSLRARYFTVKHVLLTNCGHKLDMINQPKTNCENCWFTFFNTHPKLVEVADEFFRNHGKGPMIGMRGKKFVTNFLRYMATVIHMMKEEEALKAAQENNESTSGITSSTESESGEVAPSTASPFQSGQGEGDRGGDEVAQ